MLDGGNNNDDVIGQRAGTQARTAIESVQEFQVITNQFDAQFGRTTGAVINAVTKSGTNDFHGSAFAFGQDADWTAKDYFAKERNLNKPDTQRREFGGTIGGPIVKDKAHFFFSLERVMIDRGAAIVIPARPDLNWSPTTQDRVWNTMIKFDQQVNANHTWGVRWLRELSPQRNQAITPPLITSAAIREEDDKDQTVVAHVLVRLRQHEVELPARRLDAGRRCVRESLLHRQRPRSHVVRADAHLPDLHRSAGQHRPGACQRRLSGRRHVLLVPAQQARRSRRQVRRAVRVRQCRQRQSGQHERHVHALARATRPFNAADPRTYPGSPDGARAGSVASSSRRRTTCRSSRRTNGRWATA